MSCGPEEIQATWGVAWDSGPLGYRTKMFMKAVGLPGGSANELVAENIRPLGNNQIDCRIHIEDDYEADD